MIDSLNFLQDESKPNISVFYRMALFHKKIIFYGLLIIFIILTCFNRFVYEKIKTKLLQSLYLFQDEIDTEADNALKTRIHELEQSIHQLKGEVEKKESLITSLSFKLTQKNELNTTIKDNIQKVSDKLKRNDSKELVHVLKLLKNQENSENEWENMEAYISEVQGDFIQRLKSKFPKITSTDLKMCIYLRMNLTSKEIARLSNLTVRGIEASRYRLRKKLNIDSETNLTDFILSI
jgi:hypothetical protein